MFLTMLGKEKLGKVRFNTSPKVTEPEKSRAGCQTLFGLQSLC